MANHASNVTGSIDWDEEPCPAGGPIPGTFDEEDER